MVGDYSEKDTFLQGISLRPKESTRVYTTKTIKGEYYSELHPDHALKKQRLEDYRAENVEQSKAAHIDHEKWSISMYSPMG